MAFMMVWETAIQILGRYKLQHGIPQELKSLIGAPGQIMRIMTLRWTTTTMTFSMSWRNNHQMLNLEK